jgi:hypothetical protein
MLDMLEVVHVNNPLSSAVVTSPGYQDLDYETPNQEGGQF